MLKKFMMLDPKHIGVERLFTLARLTSVQTLPGLSTCCHPYVSISQESPYHFFPFLPLLPPPLIHLYYFLSFPGGVCEQTQLAPFFNQMITPTTHYLSALAKRITWNTVLCHLIHFSDQGLFSLSE